MIGALAACRVLYSIAGCTRSRRSGTEDSAGGPSSAVCWRPSTSGLTQVPLWTGDRPWSR